MHHAIEAAKAEFVRSTDRVTNAINSTPGDKQDWSPSDSSRTPTQIVAHCALSISGMQGWLEGKPFPFGSMKELDDFSRAEEAKMNLQQSLDLLSSNKDVYLAWLDTLSTEQVESMFSTMMGEFPMAAAITFPADHLRSHAAQIDYIQTIYGDREMRMG